MIHVNMNFILYYMIGSSRMDDEIIYSWCFNSVEYFDSTSSVAVIVLVENSKSLSSLRSQQEKPAREKSVEKDCIGVSFFQTSHEGECEILCKRDREGSLLFFFFYLCPKNKLVKI